MPVDPEAVRAVHREVRALFKDSLKSSNKIYSFSGTPVAARDHFGKDAKIAPGSENPKAMRRKLNGEAAIWQIKQMRDFFLPWLHEYPTDYGYYVLDQNELAGNCEEQACVAAYLCTLKNLNFVWMAHIQKPMNHAFCIVTDGTQPTMRSVSDFYKERARFGWVIDPWANICCPIHQYAAHFVLHMRHWRAQGKSTYSPRETMAARGVPMFAAPDTPLALADFRYSPIIYVKTKRAGIRSLPKAFRNRPPFWASLEWPMAF